MGSGEGRYIGRRMHLSILLCFHFLSLVFTKESPGTDQERKTYLPLKQNDDQRNRMTITVNKEVSVAATFFALPVVFVILFAGHQLMTMTQRRKEIRVVGSPHSCRQHLSAGTHGEEFQLKLSTVDPNHQIADAPKCVARPTAALPHPRGVDMRKHPFSMEYHLLKLLGLIEILPSNIKISRILSEGEFGTIFVGELAGSDTRSKSDVIVKILKGNVVNDKKYAFIKKVRALSCLRDPNFAWVLGICIDEQSIGVVVESLEYGDLCGFLRKNYKVISDGVYKRIQPNDLLFIICQVVKGMTFLVKMKLLHKDLAARCRLEFWCPTMKFLLTNDKNCVIGKGLRVKLSYFGKDMETYDADYFLIGSTLRLPLRWMSWESTFMQKYTEKSDVWSFGVLMWEILTFCLQTPYPTMDNENVLANLGLLGLSSGFQFLEKLPGINDKLYLLMLSMWRREENERPSFEEINSYFLKSLSDDPASLEGNRNSSTRKEAINLYDNPLVV